MYKKGDLGDYILLIYIGYKMCALILLNRLNAVGAEERIWKTQYGFRGRRGILDALFVVC